MADYKLGDAVSIIRGGKEITGKVAEEKADGSVVFTGEDAYSTFTVHRSKLLRPKGPFFEVRGQVLTTSATHSGVVGEIIATGAGPMRGDQPGKRFFQVLFDGDPKADWFSEDQVFLEDVRHTLIVDL